MGNYRCWLRRFVLSAAGIFIVSLGFNFVVDPYAIYDAVSIPGWNSNKHVATSHSRTIKPYLLKRLQPRGIILGSSRAEVGLDPGHPGWGAAAQPVYNYAVGGVGIAELAGRFESAVANAPVEKALIGLDFYMFNAYLSDWSSKYAVKNDWHLYFKTLATIDALKASIESLRKNDEDEYPGILKTGQVAWSFNKRRVSRYGHKNGFLRFEKHFLEDSMFPLPHKKFEFYDPNKGNDAFVQFRRLLKTARDNNVDLKLFISPVHARLLIVYQQNGLWGKYCDWKRTLVTLLAEEAASRPGQAAFPLYDFSGINYVTVEDVPNDGDTQTKMKYYWESSHYKNETGNLIQSRIFDVESNEPEKFGVMLNSANVEKVLADTDLKLAEYIKLHKNDYSEIARMKAESTWHSAGDE